MQKQKSSDQAIVLAERQGETAGICVSYHLEFANGFWIVARYGTEMTRVFVGHALGVAWEIFLAVSAGGVTPCALDDICADLLWLHR